MTPRRCFVLLIVLLLVTSAPASARQDSATTPLDLAAMVLTPADLAAAGWDGLGLASGQTLSAADLAYRAVWPKGEGEEQNAVRDALLAAGWQHGYAATFATFWDPNRSDPGCQVEVEIIAYADAAGAAKGFGLVSDVYPTGPVKAVAGNHIGDEARLVRVEARDPQAGMPAQELALGFRRERLTARILLRDWTGGEPEVAAAEALATRLLARIESVLQDGGPGLSIQALRVERLEYAAHFDYYLRLAGEDVRLTYESPTEFAARVTSYGGATDVFTSGTEIAANDSGDNLGFGADLYGFPDADRASAWLREAPIPLGQEVNATAFAIEDENAVIGDEAVSVTVSRDPGRDGMDVNHTSAVLFRIGAVVAEIQVTRTNAPPPVSSASELAAAQAACLAAADCLHHERPGERRGREPDR